MSSRSHYLLLPLLGALSAIVAFAVASPFLGTLDRPNLSPNDPAAHYSTGTLWDIVEHVVFGALLLGTFTFVIKSAEQGLKRGVLAGLMGTVVGAIAVPLANSGSDLAGIQIERVTGFPSFFNGVIWCVLVPTTVAFSLAFCLGLTPQRIKRASVASWRGFFATLVCQYFVGPLLVLSILTTKSNGDFNSLLANNTLRLSVNQWEIMDITIGVTMGLLFAFAQNRIRTAWVRLVAGRNEFRDWNLDDDINRIGSAEGVQVNLRNTPAVAPVHAEIIQHKDHFELRDLVGATYLNGIAIQHAWLNPGDHIQVGHATLLFMTGRGNVAVRMPAPVFQVQQPMAQSQQIVQQEPTLEHRLSDGFGHVHVMAPGTTTIGRDPANTISVTWDSSVSRFHCEVETGSDETVFRDLGSSNGSKVNGTAVSQAVLKPGDVIELGSTCLRYDVGRDRLGKN